MIARCTDPANKSYVNYGGRGIEVCDRWKRFENFFFDMKEPPVGLQLERLDNGRGYEPDNCAWKTPAENSRNRRNNVVLEFQGKTQTLVEWSIEIGISFGTLAARISAGWPVERVLTETVRRWK